MELRQLKYFVTVAKTLNFSEAARLLYITQGTLSQQIMQLEDELDCILLLRSSHSVSLTEAGEELLPLAQKTLEDSADCKTRIRDLKQVMSGTLSIGVTHSFSGLLTDTVKAFVKLHPGVKLDIHYKTASELFDMLGRRELDFILAFKPWSMREDVESETLFVSHLSVIMRKDHPLADRKSLSLHDIEKQGVALPGSGLQARKAFERFVNVDTSNLDVRVEMNDPNIIMDILRSTNLISVMSSLAIHYQPSLVAIPLECGSREMIGSVHWLKCGYHKKSAETFISMLRDSAQVHRLMLEL